MNGNNFKCSTYGEKQKEEMKSRTLGAHDKKKRKSQGKEFDVDKWKIDRENKKVLDDFKKVMGAS